VIRQKNQFSWYTEKRKITNLELYEEIYELSKTAYYSESFLDKTNGSLYFHNKELRRPEWTTNMVKTATIGNHQFYR
jgi:spore germination cell wall hydrolase CwlJ-like protein